MKENTLVMFEMIVRMQKKCLSKENDHRILPAPLQPKYKKFTIALRKYGHPCTICQQLKKLAKVVYADREQDCHIQKCGYESKKF